MKPEELLCEVLYLDGTVANELLPGKKVIAIVVGDTLISLKNQIQTNYQEAERQCERLKFADGHFGYLALKSEFELWVAHKKEINATIRVLRENGINADYLLDGTAYWVAGGDKFFGYVVNASSGCHLMQSKGALYISRAAITI